MELGTNTFWVSEMPGKLANKVALLAKKSAVLMEISAPRENQLPSRKSAPLVEISAPRGNQRLSWKSAPLVAISFDVINKCFLLVL